MRKLALVLALTAAAACGATPTEPETPSVVTVKLNVDMPASLTATIPDSVPGGSSSLFNWGARWLLKCTNATGAAVSVQNVTYTLVDAGTNAVITQTQLANPTIWAANAEWASIPNGATRELSGLQQWNGPRANYRIDVTINFNGDQTAKASTAIILP